MSQNDFTIANQTFPNTRADINSALQALASTSSGASEPSTTFANQLWYDTSTNKLYIRNEDNDANILLLELDQTNDTVEYFSSDSVRTPLIEYTDGTDALTIGSGGELTTSSTLDVNGNELILDADADTSITADTDDRIDLRVGGTDRAYITNNTIGGIINRLNAKPVIINGNMAVAQRGQTQTGQTGDHFPVDRFGFQMSNFGTWTSSQSTDVPTGQGFTNSLKLDCTTADASLGANDFGVIHYRFEGQDAQLLKKGTSSAEKVTISFWVKSNTTGNYVIELYDVDNTRQISQLYSISSANTWEKKIVTFAGDTTGALDNDNLNSFVIHWTLGAGSTFSSGTLNTSWASSVSANRWVGGPNLADNTANDWYLTGVQLEVGEYNSTTLPPFQYESFGDSLLRCQRYYEKTNPATETPDQTDGAVSANWGILNTADSSTLVLSMIQWKVDKRVSPTMTFYATDGTSGNLNVNGTNRAVTASFVGETNLGRISVASGGTAGNYVAFMFEASAEV